jgi:hypothetical protein
LSCGRVAHWRAKARVSPLEPVERPVPVVRQELYFFYAVGRNHPEAVILRMQVVACRRAVYNRAVDRECLQPDLLLPAALVEVASTS